MNSQNLVFQKLSKFLFFILLKKTNPKTTTTTYSPNEKCLWVSATNCIFAIRIILLLPRIKPPDTTANSIKNDGGTFAMLGSAGGGGGEPSTKMKVMEREAPIVVSSVRTVPSLQLIALWIVCVCPCQCLSVPSMTFVVWKWWRKRRQWQFWKSKTNFGFSLVLGQWVWMSI